MDAALAAAAYTVETVVEGGVALAKGLSLSTAPLKATFKRVPAPSIPRSSHTLCVIKNRAYIFGGEISPREPVDNAMHIVNLPATDLTEADYQVVEAKPSTPGGPVPEARVGHSATAIDNSIYVFGGRGGADMKALEEKGRVWVYDTTKNTWSYLDPIPDSPYPESRSYHASAATQNPLPHPPARKTAEASEDLDDGLAYGELPDGDRLTGAEPLPPNTYGTVIVHAGCLSSGGRTSDVWSFDIASRTWAPFPTAPDPARGGTTLTIVRDRMYRFGGFDGTSEVGGGVDYLELNPSDVFDDKAGVGTMALMPRSPAEWQTTLFAPSSDKEGKGRKRTAPDNRSVCGVAPVTTGQGREYLLLICGEGEASTMGHAGAGRFFDDVWSFQLKPVGLTAGAFKDATRQYILGKGTGEADAVEVQYYVPVEQGSGQARMIQEGQPRPLGHRGWFACASCADAGAGPGSVLVWGGLGEDNERLGDGWIISVE